jgi:hypothetical protein
MAGYSGTPLVQKLGIKPGMRVVLPGAPPGFRRELVDLPAGVSIGSRAAGAPDLIIWFVSSERDLHKRVAHMGRLMRVGLWIAWPKKASGILTDLTGNLVRQAGLAHGLVDYKVCAINETWSGLKFARRQSAPARPADEVR